MERKNDGTFGETKMSPSLEAKEKAEILKKSRNKIIISLCDQILRKVIKEKTVAGMWLKLEQLFMTKALPNRIYLKQKFYGFNMDESKTIDENVDEFIQLVANLENLNAKIDKEDQTIFLLNFLPKQYDQLRDTLKLGSTDTNMGIRHRGTRGHGKFQKLGHGYGKDTT